MFSEEYLAIKKNIDQDKVHTLDDLREYYKHKPELLAELAKDFLRPLKCTTCVRLRVNGLSLELMEHYQDHIYHCNWFDYTDFCPHNLGKK